MCVYVNVNVKMTIANDGNGCTNLSTCSDEKNELEYKSIQIKQKMMILGLFVRQSLLNVVSVLVWDFLFLFIV